MIVVCYCVLYFFFFKQKTAYEMRISDWSSDVCSSDLPDQAADARDHQPLVDEEVLHIFAVDHPDQDEHDERQRADDIGRGLRFGRHRPDIELHLPALAQHRREVGERLGEVAAGLALERDRNYEERGLDRTSEVKGK